MFTAKEIMTNAVVAVTPDTTIEEAVQLFETHRVSGLPVVDGNHQVVGIITEYDLLRSITTLQMRGHVADFMKTDVVTVDEDVSLADLAELLMLTRVRRVPVTRDGELMGVISRRDLIFAGNIRQQLIDLPLVSSSAERS